MGVVFQTTPGSPPISPDTIQKLHERVANIQRDPGRVVVTLRRVRHNDTGAIYGYPSGLIPVGTPIVLQAKEMGGATHRSSGMANIVCGPTGLPIEPDFVPPDRPRPGGIHARFLRTGPLCIVTAVLTRGAVEYRVDYYRSEAPVGHEVGLQRRRIWEGAVLEAILDCDPKIAAFGAACHAAGEKVRCDTCIHVHYAFHELAAPIVGWPMAAPDPPVLDSAPVPDEPQPVPRAGKNKGMKGLYAHQVVGLRDKLLEQRDKAHWNLPQTKVGAMFGWYPKRYGDCESGEVRFFYEEIQLLAGGYRLDVDWLRSGAPLSRKEDVERMWRAKNMGPPPDPVGGVTALGFRLRGRRCQMGISVEELAERTSIDPDVLQRIDDGVEQPTEEEFAALQRATETTPAWLRGDVKPSDARQSAFAGDAWAAADVPAERDPHPSIEGIPAVEMPPEPVHAVEIPADPSSPETPRILIPWPMASVALPMDCGLLGICDSRCMEIVFGILCTGRITGRFPTGGPIVADIAPFGPMVMEEYSAILEALTVHRVDCVNATRNPGSAGRSASAWPAPPARVDGRALPRSASHPPSP